MLWFKGNNAQVMDDLSVAGDVNPIEKDVVNNGSSSVYVESCNQKVREKTVKRFTGCNKSRQRWQEWGGDPKMPNGFTSYNKAEEGKELIVDSFKRFINHKHMAFVAAVEEAIH